MNRRERRAQWLAHHRGDASAGSDAGASGTLRREPPAAAGQGLRDTHDQRAGRVETVRVVGSLRLHIEEVVLHGFDPRERYTVGDAVQQELTWLMTERSVPSLLDAPRLAERLDAGTFHVTPNSRPQALGAQVARAVYGGLKR